MGQLIKGEGRWHHQKLNFVHVPFTNKRLEYNIKYFTQYHQTHLLLDIDTKIQNGFDIPWTKLWIRNFITEGKYIQIILTTNFFGCYKSSFVIWWYWVIIILCFSVIIPSISFVFCIPNFLIQFEKSSPYLSRKSGFVGNFNTQKPKFSER